MLFRLDCHALPPLRYHPGMDEKRKPLWPKIVATVLLLPVLYVLSAGPVQGLYERGMIPKLILPVVQGFYYPLMWLEMHGPRWFHEAMRWYFGLCSP